MLKKKILWILCNYPILEFMLKLWEIKPLVQSYTVDSGVGDWILQSLCSWPRTSKMQPCFNCSCPNNTDEKYCPLIQPWHQLHVPIPPRFVGYCCHLAALFPSVWHPCSACDSRHCCRWLSVAGRTPYLPLQTLPFPLVAGIFPLLHPVAPVSCSSCLPHCVWVGFPYLLMTPTAKQKERGKFKARTRSQSIWRTKGHRRTVIKMWIPDRKAWNRWEEELRVLKYCESIGKTGNSHNVEERGK